MTEKRPRQYAVEIMEAPKEERTELFKKVPQHLKDMVREHCVTASKLRKGK